ncbi:unnamed protein product [Closterium sp. NIES-53]
MGAVSPPPPLILAPGPPQVDPLPAPGPAPSGVSQVDPLAPALVEVTGDSSPAGSGAIPGGAELWGAESGGAERVEPGGAASGGVASGGAASGGAASGGAEPACAEPGGAESRGESPEGSETAVTRSPWSSCLRPRVPLTSQQLHNWYGRRQRRTSAPQGSPAGGSSTCVAGPGGARTRGSGAVGAGGVSAGGTGAAGGAGGSGHHTDSVTHGAAAPPSDESVEPSGPYPELVGCLMYLMTCTHPDLAYPLGLLARYVAPGRHRKVHMDAAKRVLRYLCSTSGMGLVLGGRGDVVLTGHLDASWVDDQATQRSSQGYTFSLGSGSVSWHSTRSSSVLGSSCEAEIYATTMAAQELRWLTYLLTDLGERPRSPPVLYLLPCSRAAAAWPASSYLRGHSGQHC